MIEGGLYGATATRSLFISTKTAQQNIKTILYDNKTIYIDT